MGSGGRAAPGDRIVLSDCRTLAGWPGTYGKAEGYLVGLLIGDGTLKQDKAVLSVWPKSKPSTAAPVRTRESWRRPSPGQDTAPQKRLPRLGGSAGSG